MANFKELRIVFFGTPDFAVASLAAMVNAGGNVVGVVTVADKQAGRGQLLSTSPVKDFAVAHHIPVLQPDKLKSPEFIAALTALEADIQVVVAFRMLPEIVWNMPPLGTINVHGSLLPLYRGAAPINWAIINGETITGVTTFKLKHEIDTGDILLQQMVAITPDDTAGTLHDKLMIAGADLLITTLKGIADETLREQPQVNLSGESLKRAPKIFTADRMVNWNQSSEKIQNFVRGLAPYPAAYTLLQGKTLKLFKSNITNEETGATPGSVQQTTDPLTSNKQVLRFAAIDGWVYVEELQLEGKKKMDADAFLKGFRLKGE